METGQTVKGFIVRAIGGLYSVESPSGLVTCHARGVFRARQISPCVGDQVLVEQDVITEILPRKNQIIRPPLANLDQLIFVVSACHPSPNLLLLDKFIAIAIHKQIQPILVITKLDLAESAMLEKIYQGAGVPVYRADYENQASLTAIRSLFQGKISALTGNSGVGKSTLINAIEPTLQLATGEISRKLGRGRHTTRETVLYPIAGGYLADTPGFSTFETSSYDRMTPEVLPDCFPELDPYRGKCRFSDCSHRQEPGCAVREALDKGIIAPSRYESYCTMYEEAEKIPDWEGSS